MSAIQLIRPRITDYHGIHKSQSEIDFAIQFLDEDIPLYVDPFLMWKSPSQQDQALHSIITNSFNYLNILLKKNKCTEARKILVDLSECNEVGLGVSKKRNGQRITNKQAENILKLFNDIPEYAECGFKHFEVIQLYVSGISKDRISDFSCNYIKSFLIDYTVDQCNEPSIPLHDAELEILYNTKTNQIDRNVKAVLPRNPESGGPLLFTPKRWLRYNPWINFEDCFSMCCPCDDTHNEDAPIERVKILKYNRENYGIINGYTATKERRAGDCVNDPLFSQIPVISTKQKLKDILKLPTGKDENADKRYEEYSASLMATLLYPHLDFAQVQSRTESGCLIRDMVFYNNRSIDFLDEIFATYNNRQLIIEMKNVQEITRDHLNQFNRYLHAGLGNFGILLTRNPLTKSMQKNIIDLWSAQRKCIIVLTDEDVKYMVNIYEGKQRSPIDILKKNYIEFCRKCPS